MSLITGTPIGDLDTQEEIYLETLRLLETR